MPGILTRFRIEALHDRHTIDIPIRDDKLILIGENGAGKSTVANFIYFFLTNQWHRMLEYDFKVVKATIGNNEIEVPREKLLAIKNKQASTVRKFTTSVNGSALTLRSGTLPAELLEEWFHLPPHFPTVSSLQEIMGQLSDEQMLPSELESSMQELKEAFCERVLYLPTYRRVEQDLASIFPELASSLGFRESMERWRKRAQRTPYIELVQFGMQDVEDTINRKMDELSNSLREGLSKLTGNYLRDVIQGAYRKVESEEIDELDEGAIDAIFSRIDQSVLPEPEQQELRSIVGKIRTDHYIRSEDQVVVQFLTRLIELHKHQQKKERDVQDFVNVCNQYMQNKEFVYDNTAFNLSLLEQGEIDGGLEAETKKLRMNKLSSGEKQIVSLFSQIYLVGSAKYFVIIDEPELSLSVFWQKRLLPDILKSGRCSGLIAVTHSPFICEDESVERYTHPLERFMEPIK